MKVLRHVFLDHRYPSDFFDAEVANRWNYQDFIDHPEWGQSWISFDGVVHHPGTDRVYCGLTRFDGDIFYAWDRKLESFVGLGFDKVMDRYDAKFHRGMELTADGKSLYLATALLHDVDRYHEAPGGGIYRHDITSGQTEKLGVPMKHNYIQSCAVDEKRGVIYSLHFTPEWLSAFDLKTRTSRELGPLSGGMQMAQGENLVLDDDGGVWGGWNATKAWQSSIGSDIARLFRYNPEAGRIHYFEHGLPQPGGGHGFTRVESFFNLGTGVLYASGANGSLFRVEPKTGKATYLFTPIADQSSRLTSLVMHSDGYAYGVTGRAGKCRLLRFDPKAEKYELSGEIATDGDAMFQCHDITITPDGILFAGENDHPARSSYLWEIQL